MKKLVSSGTLFLLGLLAVSCMQQSPYPNAVSFEREDFKSEQLHGEILTFDDIIMRPICLSVYDSLLITCNQGSEKLFHIFNLHTRKKIGERITVGQGPLEMLMPYFVSRTDSVQLFDMMNATVFTYAIADFVNQETPIPSSRVQLSEKPFWSELGALGRRFIGVSYKPDSPCYLFAENGEKLMNFGSYPKAHGVTYTDTEKINAYRAILATNGKNRVAVCHFFTDLIDLYDENGNLIKELYGPDHFATSFKESRTETEIKVIPDPQMYRDAFYNPVHAGDALFVLYNGKFVNEQDYNLLAKEIFVFDWDGNPKAHYKLDQGISRMAIDEVNRKIYGVSDDPEYHIVVFNY